MAKRKQLPSLERLNELLRYDADTGILYRKFLSGDKQVTYTSDKGYVYARIDSILYLAHRVIWKMYYGVEPPLEIDHIDNNKANNRISNLREATHAQNTFNRNKQRNNTSGHKGVSWHKQRNKWRAFVWMDGKQKSLGLHTDKQDAIDAVKKAQRQVHGDFMKEI